MWDQRHLDYIKHHRNGFYTALVLDCKLNRYLVDINKQAEEMFDTLISQYKNAEGITEQLKANNQMDWVCKMNSIRDRINGIIYNPSITATASASATVDISAIFENARQRVEDEGLSDLQAKEILEKIAELEEIAKSKESKGKRWSKAKEIMKWLVEQGIAAAGILIPVLSESIK